MSTGPELIKRARLAAGLTQAELARKARTAQSAIAAYESGAKVPTVDTMSRLLKATGHRLASSPALPLKRHGPISRLLRQHRAAIGALAAEHHASNVRVFGSVARGQARAGSDIDLLVDMDGDASLLDQVRLRRAVQELLGVRVDVVTSRSLLDRDSKILDEAIPI